MKRIALTGAVLLGSLLSFNLTAAQLSPEEQAAAAVKTRQGVFQLISFSVRPLAGMMRGPYDKDAAIQADERVKMLAGLIPEVFAANDTSGFDVTTRANDSIWKNMDDFKKLANELAKGADEALAVFNSGSAPADFTALYRSSFGNHCGACHDQFRHD